MYADLPGVIVYQTSEGDHESIWLFAPDGSDDHLILGATEDARHPRWSPDGEQLVFSSCPPDVPKCLVQIADADGGNVSMAYDCGDRCFGGDGASWSPNGALLAFTHYDGPVDAGPPSIAGIALGPPGGPFHDITRAKQYPDGISDQFPRWSPDGQDLVFFREKSVDGTIVHTAVFTIGVDGKGLRQLTPWSLNAGTPTGDRRGRSYSTRTRSWTSDRARPRSTRSNPTAPGCASSRRSRTTVDAPTSPLGRAARISSCSPLETGPGKAIWAMAADGSRPSEISGPILYTHPQLQPG